MGFNQFNVETSFATVSRLLWSRILYRHIVWYNDSPKDTLLHCQSCHSLHAHWWLLTLNNSNISYINILAILTTFVFYIPACEHKMTFAISILVTLTVFYLVLIELIPPTSLVIPLIGKYLLFTMFLVSGSIVISVVTLNFYRR